MGAPYSLDLRERVVGAVKGGMSRRAAAELYLIDESTAIRWVKLAAENGAADLAGDVTVQHDVAEHQDGAVGEVGQSAIEQAAAVLLEQTGQQAHGRIGSRPSS